MSRSTTYRSVTYTVPGMTCDHCKKAVSSVPTPVSGVTEVDVDLKTKLVRVSGRTWAKRCCAPPSERRVTRRSDGQRH
jgi:cation transport ATPase